MLNFVISRELSEKSAFLKIAAQAFEVGDFLNIFLRFLVFEAHFHIKMFLIKIRLVERSLKLSSILLVFELSVFHRYQGYRYN